MNQMFSGPSSLVTNAMSRDLTDADLSAHLGVVASRGAGGLNVQFFYARVQTKSRNARLSGQFQTRLCIAKQPKGDRFTVATRYISEQQAQREFPREFAAFKQFEDVPTSGTPLHELPGISQSQIGLLVINGLRSVEDLASLTADQAGQIGFEAVAAQKVAHKWLAKQEGNADLIAASEIQARADLERDAMAKRMAALEERNRMLEAQVAAVTSLGGRPVATAAQMPAQEIVSSDLPYSLDDMPPLYSEGPTFISGNDDLGTDLDPLA